MKFEYNRQKSKQNLSVIIKFWIAERIDKLASKAEQNLLTLLHLVFYVSEIEH